MWHLGTWLGSGLGSAGLMAGCDGVKALSSRNDSMNLCAVIKQVMLQASLVVMCSSENLTYYHLLYFPIYILAYLSFPFWSDISC